MISLFEDIRVKLMEKMQKVRNSLLRCNDIICLEARKRLVDSVEKQRKWKANHYGNHLFEVRLNLCPMVGYTVDLIAWTCTCRQWQITDITCPHGVSAIFEMRRSLDDYIHPYYLVETSLWCYDEAIMPLNGEHM